ncbi:MAG: hypothetical protein GWP10_07770 [Nitrospiraceae bacterium]|nr:hypothetical protein [Nitrospiraceae bacterium]
MNMDDIRKIGDQIHRDMTPQSSMAGIDGATITSKEDLDRINQLLKDRAGYYFYIDVWNCRAQLHIMHTRETGNATSGAVEIDIPDEMIMDAIHEQGGAINWSGHYAISDGIRERLQQAMGGT